MKPVDVKSSTYIDSGKEIIDKNPNFKFGDIVRMWKYKNIFAKSYVPNWSEEFSRLKNLRTLCRGYMLLLILMEKKLLDGYTSYTKKNCKETNRIEFQVEKVIKKKVGKLCYIILIIGKAIIILVTVGLIKMA